MSFYRKRGVGRTVLSILIILLTAAAAYSSICRNDLLFFSDRYGLFAIGDGGGLTPDGSLVFSDRHEQADKSEKAVFSDKNGYLIRISDGTGAKIGTEIYYLGYAVIFLNTYRPFVLAACAVILVLVIVFNATAKVRFKCRRRRRLIRVFDEYAEHFDADECRE